MKRTKPKKTKSISAKIFFSFLLIISLIIFLVWMLEIILLEPIYKNTQTNRARHLNSAIIKNFGEQNILDYVDMSLENNCSILIFTYENNVVHILHNTSRTNSDLELSIQINEHLTQLTDKTHVSYTKPERVGDRIYVGETKIINNTPTYFFVSTTLSPISSVIEVSNSLLLIISLGGLSVAALVALGLSKWISTPLQKLSKEASTISSKHDETIHFSSTEYYEVEQLSNSLNYAITEIQKSDKIQKEVVQNVSHELRTPLTIIQSYAEMIEDFDDLSHDDRKKYTTIITDECKKLETLISDMLDLSKMQAHTLEFQKTEFDLSLTLEKLEKFYSNQFPEFDFEFSYPKSTPIYADKRRIEQVITNFISNAINYSQLDKKHIIVSLAPDSTNSTLRFSVKDFGIGISPEDQTHVFDRHFRSISAKRAVSGSGIGLTIAKEILLHHDFQFGVDSTPGQGSTFYFSIPPQSTTTPHSLIPLSTTTPPKSIMTLKNKKD